MDRFVVLDPSHDMDAARATAASPRRPAAREVIGALTYTISAVHDDAFYAGIAAAYARLPRHRPRLHQGPGGHPHPGPGADADPGRAGARRSAASRLSCTRTPRSGSPSSPAWSPPSSACPCSRSAAARSATGPRCPSAEQLAANLRASGHTVDIDDRLLAAVARYFDRLAAAEGLPPGQPGLFDAAFMEHQLAGGTLSTTRRQLAEIGMADRFGALMAEIAQVRAELGLPDHGDAVPADGDRAGARQPAVAPRRATARYDNVPDQVIRYALGTFGKPTAPVEPWVLDKVLGRPRAAELAGEPPPLDVAELRKRFGARISDEELALRFGMPGPEVDAMIAAGPGGHPLQPGPVPVLGCCACSAAAGGAGADGEQAGLPAVAARQPRAEGNFVTTNEPSQEVLGRLRKARGFIFDMDGTLALGDRVNHGLARCRAPSRCCSGCGSASVPYVVFTNGTNRTPRIRGGAAGRRARRARRRG